MSEPQNLNHKFTTETAICFLIINHIKELPQVAISSALRATSSDIYVGYLDPDTLSDICKNPRIRFIQLESINPHNPAESKRYQDFGTVAFYELVQLKWALFRKISDLGYKQIIYSDIDVVWLGDAALALEKTFELFDRAHILVQSFTRSPQDSLLCMGIFAFRNSEVSRKFIEICESEHKEALFEKKNIGDDEIVTSVHRKLGFPEYVRELPQSTFAVGNFLDLYSTKSHFPGVHKPIPLIFHCNYVVGLRNKRLMLRLLLNSQQRKELQIRFGFGFYSLLILKRIRAKKIVNSVLRQFT